MVQKYRDNPLVPISALQLRVAMRRRDLAPSIVAARAGISRQRLAILTAGRNKRCRRTVRAALAKALDCRVGDLAGTTGLELVFPMPLDPSLERQDALDAFAAHATDTQDNMDPWLLVTLSTVMQFSETVDGDARPTPGQLAFRESLINLMHLDFWRELLSATPAPPPTAADDRERFAVAIANALELIIGSRERGKGRRAMMEAAVAQLRVQLPRVMSHALRAARETPS